MGQVPRYLIIGRGRMATHFSFYLQHLNLPYLTWHRGESLALLEERKKLATHILILISDYAIDAFIQKHLQTTSALLIHCSGSLASQLAYGAHPLSSFTRELFEVSEYKEITFVVDEHAPAFSELLPGLPNKHMRLPVSQKAKYHAMCVLSGNFSCMLWQKFFATLEQEFAIPAECGQHYLKRITQNLLSDYQNALTGPLVRNDIKTIEKNINALKDDPFQKIYKSFVECYQTMRAEELV